MKRLILAFCVLMVLPFAGLAAEYSGLWGAHGELWDNSYPNNSISGRIADVSHAGYDGGDAPIPFYPVAINVTDAPYNAVPNDGIDDSAAIQAAIDACPATGAAVYIPEGTYDLSATLSNTCSGVVLRGAGPDKTVLKADNKTVVQLTGNKTITGICMIKGFSRGQTQITDYSVAHNVQAGDLIQLALYVKITDPEWDGFIWENIGGEQIDGFVNTGWYLQMYAKVVSVNVSQNTVFLDRPLEFTSDPSGRAWNVYKVTGGRSGVEDLTVTCSPDFAYATHFNGSAPGVKDDYSEGIKIDDCVNSWVRNVLIKECSGGVSAGSVQCTISDVVLDSQRLSRSEFPLLSGLDYDYAFSFDPGGIYADRDCKGHYGIELYGRHLLAERIKLNYPCIHDLSVHDTQNCVFSDIQGLDISLDHHRQMPARNLYTDIDAGLGRKFWLSSGDTAQGIQCGAWETFWNVDSVLEQDFPEWAPAGNVFCRGYINVVGIHTLADPVTDADPRWFEADIAPEDLAPGNLYEAMRIKRFAANGWDNVPPAAAASADSTQGRGSLSVNFTGSGSSDNTGVVSYLWEFGDGTTSRNTNPQHTYTAPGIYTASLTVRDARNLRDTQEITITVLESDAQYELTYKPAPSALLENYELRTGHVLIGATNQVVAEGGSASTVIAVPGAGNRFVAWSDGVTSAARTDTNVQESKVLEAYFMTGMPPAGNGPNDLSLDTNLVDENCTNGTLVGTVTATDPDAGETFSYQLINDAGGRFTIDSVSGELRVTDAALLDYATAQSHIVRVIVVDSTSQAYSEDMTILVDSAGEPTPDLDNGLYLHWDLNGDAEDCSVNGRDGTVSGTEAWAAGCEGQGLVCNGTDTRATYDFSMTTWPAFTVSLWAKSAANGQATYTGIFNNDSSGADFQINLDGSDRYSFTGGNYFNEEMGAAVLGEWAHLLIRCDGIHSDLYYNGVKQATLSDACRQFGRIDIGVNRGNNNFFDGTIDELRVYDRCLTDREVDMICNAFSNNPPEANNQSITAVGTTPVAITLAGSDANGDSLTYTVETPPDNGTLSGTAPNLTYTADAGFTGSDSFTFSVNDGTTNSTPATVSITVEAAQGGEPVELLVNGSYESGASNFNFTGNYNNLPLSVDMVGQWVSRESGEDFSMDLTDISATVSGQDGGISMLFRSSNKRGLVQVVDVSQIDVSGLELSFAASFAAPGREGMTSADMACYQVVGFNDFTELTVDIGGDYSFTGGTYDNVVAKRTIADAELSGSAYTTFSENVTLASDYNYLAVLVGGLAGANNSDTQFVAVDRVSLELAGTGDVDSDGDGLTDAQEIRLGTDPDDPHSVFVIKDNTLLPATGKMRLAWPSATGVLYRVWQSPDLVDWSVVREWEAAQTPPEDVYEVDLTLSNSFFRIDATFQ